MYGLDKGDGEKNERDRIVRAIQKGNENYKNVY